MALQKAFTIDQVSWHLQDPGSPVSREDTIRRFRAIATFLQENALTVRPLLQQGEHITDAFAIESCDLTPEGFTLMRNSYEKWLRKIERGMPSTDLSVLHAELNKLRKESSQS